LLRAVIEAVLVSEVSPALSLLRRDRGTCTADTGRSRIFERRKPEEAANFLKI